MGDSVEGNEKNILVPNIIAFSSSNDPRLPVLIRTTAGDARTPLVYPQTSAER